MRVETNTLWLITIIMLTDQSIGTLVFSINGKDLGVAVDGLVGPLYPAFSLYNEDDQLSLSPPRQPSIDTDIVGGSRCGTSSAERVMQRFPPPFLLLIFQNCHWIIFVIIRVQMLHSLFLYFHESNKSEDDTNFSSTQLITEFSRRWTLWRNDIGLRTIRIDGDIVSVLVSPLVCLSFSENR